MRSPSMVLDVCGWQHAYQAAAYAASRTRPCPACRELSGSHETSQRRVSTAENVNGSHSRQHSPTAGRESTPKASDRSPRQVVPELPHIRIVADRGTWLSSLSVFTARLQAFKCRAQVLPRRCQSARQNAPASSSHHRQQPFGSSQRGHTTRRLSRAHS